MLVRLVPRFRRRLLLWRCGQLMVACTAASGIFGTAAAVAQVPPVGATAEVRDAAGHLIANAAFREGRGEVLIAVTFPNPTVLTGTHGVRITSVGRCDPPDFT